MAEITIKDEEIIAAVLLMHEAHVAMHLDFKLTGRNLTALDMQKHEFAVDLMTKLSEYTIEHAEEIADKTNAYYLSFMTEEEAAEWTERYTAEQLIEAARITIEAQEEGHKEQPPIYDYDADPAHQQHESAHYGSGTYL